MKANATFAWCWPDDGGGIPNVTCMRRTTLVVAGLLAAGCSTGGGTAATGGPSPSATTTSAAPVASSPAAGPGESAVPAEKNPPGDIPDNLAFIPYRSSTGRYSFTHPEGWAETAKGTSVTFTDKLNGVQVQLGSRTTAPTIDTAKQQDVPQLKAGQAAFELRGISAVTEPAGAGVRIVYRRNSAPDAVTGRQYRDEVERYELVASGREVIVELYGPVGADNVDAYARMIKSLRFA